jgi:hypothetical protein
VTVLSPEQPGVGDYRMSEAPVPVWIIFPPDEYIPFVSRIINNRTGQSNSDERP